MIEDVTTWSKMVMTSNSQIFRSFKDLGEGSRSVHLDWYGNDTVRAMAEGFKNSSDRVVQAAAVDIGHPDQYFWPVAFMYRHALELMLKEIIQSANLCLDRPITLAELRGHDLDDLWRRARQLILDIWPTGDAAELVPTELVIKDLHMVDPNGDAFRYRTDRSGRTHLEQLPRVFSLTHLASSVTEAFDFLDGVLLGIEHLLDARYEVEGR